MKGKPVLFSVFWYDNCWPKGSESETGLSTRWQTFCPGDVRKCPMSYWSFFERNLVGLADFDRLEVPTDGQLSQFRFFYRNWLDCGNLPVSYNYPSFDFFIETGPVGHPLEFEHAKSANATTVDSCRKLTNSSLREKGTFCNVPGIKLLPKC